MTFESLFYNDSLFNKIMILLRWKPKKYNKKPFVLSIMLIEFLLKGPFMSPSVHTNSSIFIKSNSSKKIVSLTYILKLQISFIFLDFFLTHIYWTLNQATKLLNTDSLELNFQTLPSPNYTISKILDSTLFVRNKIQLESFFLKKNYDFKIVFLGINYVHYLWWARCFGFYKFI